MLNVLKGDLTLVGPRPSVPEHLEDMTKREKERYSVKPGLTGLAQVSGNIHLTWKERYEKDLLYVHNVSFINDLKILVRTFFLIFRGEAYYKNKPLKIVEYS
jgi:lipopolysaccharide/colanic/teichoic acid biosynthesis glycosyltransferase